MSYEIEGKLIVKSDTVQISDSFQKREFVIEQETVVVDAVYTETIKFQVVQAKCETLDGVNIGDTIKVDFNIKGRKWEKDGKVNYFNNLDAWKVSKVEGVDTTPAAEEVKGDLPF